MRSEQEYRYRVVDAFTERSLEGDASAVFTDVSEQGIKMGRRSLLHVHIRGNSGAEGIDIGGYVTPLATATMRLGF